MLYQVHSINYNGRIVDQPQTFEAANLRSAKIKATKLTDYRAALIYLRDAEGNTLASKGYYGWSDSN